MEQQQQQAAARPRQFQVNRTSFARHYTITSTADGQQAFYVDISSFTRGKPDLTVHEGDSSRGPIVAVAHMPKFSGDFKIGLGAGGGGDVTTQWEDMTSENLRRSTHRWTMNLGGDGVAGSGSGRGPRRRRAFAWKRTRRVGADGASVSSLSGRNLKLVAVGDDSHSNSNKNKNRSNNKDDDDDDNDDNGDDEVLAVFTSERGFKSCGVLQINASLGRDFDVMVVTTFVALYEKARRRRSAAAAGGGAGGGAA
ncbi:Postreplication repair E3 ubiquitin-protein ligase rad18 [Purpureocillium lavendulum]|uniref:Postreplication repair E3 ubiquitin-protein ligase rad18 n=1 Tax=Purpureocillium lavendulum TaxID=1247861 RepID=A0AB34FWC2_9HYPO|nr:Postreplication repair E3 ubiquitin-protein ligase rad18 [Purpureocillium lavendulum]